MPSDNYFPEPQLQLMFQDLYPDMQDWILDDVIAWIADLGNKVSQYFNELYEWVSSMLNWLRNSVINAIPQQLNNWWYGIKSIFDPLFTTMYQVWYKLWTIGSEIYQQVSQAIQGIAYQITSTVSSFFAQLPGQISAAVASVWGWLSTWAANITSTVSAWIQQLGSNIGTWFSEQWQHIIDFWNGFTTNFTEWIGNIGTWFTSLGADLGKIPNLVLAGIEDIAKNLGKGITDWLEKDIHEANKEMEGAADFDELAKGSPFWAALVLWAGLALAKIWPWLVKNLLPSLGKMLGGALPFMAVLALEETGVMDNLIEKYVVPAFNDVLSFFEGLGPMAPQAGGNIAVPMAKVLEVTITGLSTFVLAGGMLGFLKQVGLGQVSAMIYDLINFRTLTASFMTALATVYIARPVEYYYQSIARPYLPGMNYLLQMVSQRVIDKGTFMQLARFHGYSDDYLDKFFDVSTQPARYFALRGIAESGFYDEVYFTQELRHASYNDDTVKQLLAMLQRYSLGEIKSRFVAHAINRFKEGFTDEGQYRTELLALGIGEPQHKHYVFGANLLYQYDYAMDLISAYRTEFNKGMISEADLKGLLSQVITNPDRVNGIALIENAKKFKAPKEVKVPAVVPEYLTDDGKLKANTAIEAFRRDIASAPELYAELIKLQMEPELAEAYVEYEIIKKTPKTET